MEDLRDPYQAERLAAAAPDAFQSRREFLQKTAMAAGLGAGLGLALDPNLVIAQAAAKQRRQAAIPSARNLPIDTFVVLMMENRSFDHYLGWLPNADGRQAGLSFTDADGAAHATHRLADFYQSCGYLDPDHSWDGGRTELDGGKMDGFLKAASDIFSIGYYTQEDLPFTPANAQAFTAFDRFFCSLLGPTYPNREYMHAGQSYGMTDNSLPFGATQLGFPDTTIFAALKNVGVSSQYYFVDIPFSALWGTAGLSRSSQVQSFYEQAAVGTLPSVCFVDPSFAGEDQGVSGDEHPLADVRIGQAYMADIVHACMDSPQWERMAVFCVYDEWGGFFDHVVPPRVPDIRASRSETSDFGQMGFRIPAVLASPYARRGYVDHSIYGFESILKMIRYRFGIDTPLTTRDLYANNIAAAFDFDSDPNLNLPDLPRPATVIAASCPGTPPVDTGGTGVDDGSVLGSPLLSSDVRRDGRLGDRNGRATLPPTERMARQLEEDRRSISPALVKKDAERHDAYSMVSTGYLERLGFDYTPARASDMFREPSGLGFKP
jgi:phospholipase C